MKTNNNLNKIDPWTAVHFFGCMAIVMVTFAIIYFNIGLTSWCLRYSFFTGVICGGIWELFDSVYENIHHRLTTTQTRFWDTILDPRGGSWLDFVFDTVGAGAGVLVLYGIMRLL